MSQLSGAQYKQFSEVLRQSFSPAELKRTLRFKLDKNLDDLSLADSYEALVFDLIGAAERQGWTDRLLLAAREANPASPMLLAYAQQFGLAPVGLPTRPNLERLINEANSYLDIAKWRTLLGLLETQVCRVEIAGSGSGTGFLLGPSVVLTNYHVVEKVKTANEVRLRFDYKQRADGKTLNPGVEYQLDAAEWLVDHSPYSAIDLQPLPHTQDPAEDELDYALLRVAGAPGDDPVGGSGDPEGQMRQWIALPKATHDFRANPALYIVQHPKGAPMKLALDTQAVLDVNSNGTRVTYRTNTEPGSSGSPCFDQNWNLVALHHSGDPTLLTPTWNEGIPMTKIVALLEKRGHASLLGEQAL